MVDVSMSIIPLGQEGENSVPRWLKSLLEEKFFHLCGIHASAKKNEKNTFCLDCCTSICPHCLPRHPKSHRLLQIRRYVYHDVIRLSDAQKLLSCSLVQPYTTNSAKVVFLNQRPMTRPFRCSGNCCVTCDRSLQDNYLFCSLSCKVQHIQKTTKRSKLKKVLNYDQGNHILQIRSLSQFGDGHCTPNTVLHSPTSLPSSCELTLSASKLDLSTDFLDFATAASASKTGCLPPADFTTYMNRRKGVPHRSPLY